MLESPALLYESVNLDGNLPGPILVGDAKCNLGFLDPTEIAKFPDRERRFLEISARMVKEVLARSVVYREADRHLVDMIFQQKLHSQPQEGPKSVGVSRLFAYEENGNWVSVMAANGEDCVLGGYGDLYAHLERQEIKAHAIDRVHTDKSLNLAGLDTDSLVCEMGAGLDIDRLQRMHTTVTRAGGVFICHDIAPRLARVGMNKLPKVPYVALPPFKEVLGEALKSYEGRKVVTLKNTLTSMTLKDMELFWDMAEYADIERLVFTQTAGHVPSQLLKGEENALDEFITVLIKKVLPNGLSTREKRILETKVKVRATHLARIYMAEYVRSYVIERSVQRDKYRHVLCCSSSSECVLKDGEVEDFFIKRELASLIPLWKAKVFNEMRVIPGMKSFHRNASVNPRFLKVSSKAFHYVLSKTPVESANLMNSLHDQVLGGGVPVAAFVMLDTMLTGVTPEEIHSVTRNEIDDWAKLVATRAVHDLLRE